MSQQPTIGGSADAGRALQLALFVENVTDYAIFLLDAEGRIASWNPGAERINGYRADEIIGQHFGIFYTPEDLARNHPAYELEVARAEGRYEEEGWRVRKDGTRFWASVVITGVFDHDGELVGYGKVTRDLTDRRAAEERLRRANAELSRFASVAAHDLREPLRSIVGFSGLLRHRHGDELGARASEFLQHIETSAENMQQLIDDLLAYARAGEAAPPGDVVDVHAAVERLRLELGAAISERDAVLDNDVPEGTVVCVARADVDAVLRNLLSNALKFSPETPRVRVRSEAIDGAVRVWVEDQGIGIPNDELPRIFEPFQRLHGASEYPGTGLGLAICQRVVVRNGGGIGVESTPGAGTRFWFSLPTP